MDRYGSSSFGEEQQPIAWVRGYGLYAAHFVVLVYVASMLVTTVLMAAQVDVLQRWLPFSSGQVLSGQVWRIFTYGLFNPPSLNFVIDMLMIVWFGREVEKFFGRHKFLSLYAGIYLLPPLLFTALGPWLPTSMAGEFGALAIFIAFATLYPNVPMMFNILAKWAALVLVGIFTLMALAAHAWVDLISLWAVNGFAHAFVRYQQGIFVLPKFPWPSRRPKLRVLPGLPAAKMTEPKKNAAAQTSMAEVDALLDKIAKSGLASLTAKERAQLDAARSHLLKRETGRR